MIYFTSDLHLGHPAAIKFGNRPFRDVEEMNKTLISNFNSIIKPNDTVYILGDIAYRLPVEKTNELIKKLNGKKILIRGNHDKKYDKRLFEGIYDYLEISLNKKKIVLMHYPMLEWNCSFHGSYQFHGHIHSKGDEYNKECKENNIRRYDVGVDANNWYPVSAQQIFDFLKMIKRN